MAAKVKDGETNWFQLPQEPLSPLREAAAVRDGAPIVRLSWQTAIAVDYPIRHYEVARNDRQVGVVQHRRQTTKEPFTFEEPV